jgi:hypothetical protein
LNLNVNRQQNYYSYRKCRGCHSTNRKYFFRPRRSRYHEEATAGVNEEISHPLSRTHSGEYMYLIKILNTKGKIHQRYKATKKHKKKESKKERRKEKK